MANKNKITAPKGTHDILPSEIYIWQKTEKNLFQAAENYGYKEIRFPTFENTELFNRGVGDTTDVVQKEMYTFNDKGNRSITLRPEGTASTVRAYLENGLFNSQLPVKLCYRISCFRYERPQAGRFREFSQFGVENFGSVSPYTDAEVISLAINMLNSVGVKGLKLYINSIGCVECRNKYNKLLKEYLDQNKDKLCELCNERKDKNPLRVLDCKNPSCNSVIENAPKISTILCDDCISHFEQLKNNLKSTDIAFEVDESLVRGLDYYTRTVFEIKSGDISGSQLTVCGGGRYDGLIEQLGGEKTPGIGFSIGLERLVEILKKQNVFEDEYNKVKIFIGSIGENAKNVSYNLVMKLRNKGISAEFDHLDRSVKAQMKYANKINAEFTAIIGDDEIKNEILQLKNMCNGEVKEASFKELCNNYEEILKN